MDTNLLIVLAFFGFCLFLIVMTRKKKTQPNAIPPNPVPRQRLNLDNFHTVSPQERKRDLVRRISRARDRYQAAGNTTGRSAMSRILEEIAVAAATHEALDYFHHHFNDHIQSDNEISSIPEFTPGGGNFGGAGANGSWDDNTSIAVAAATTAAALTDNS